MRKYCLLPILLLPGAVPVTQINLPRDIELAFRYVIGPGKPRRGGIM